MYRKAITINKLHAKKQALAKSDSLKNLHPSEFNKTCKVPQRAINQTTSNLTEDLR
jgi:hypothetical protein